MEQYRNGTLTFDVRDDGPKDGDVVVLLHGYPETKASWDDVVPGLANAGFRVLAPDQRGYSPRARPKGRHAYTADRLVSDVLALADAAGVERFHLVGHDWGGMVAWYCAMWHPERLKTMTSLATPHPRALIRSFAGSQLLRSWYVFFYQLPRVPEWTARTSFGEGRFRGTLLRSGLPADKLDAYMAVLDEPDARTATINWYRAAAFTPPTKHRFVTVPTLYIYGTRDFALGPKAADRTGRYVTGPYRYERLDATHWMPEEVPDVVTRLVLEHIASADVLR